MVPTEIITESSAGEPRLPHGAPENAESYHLIDDYVLATKVRMRRRRMLRTALLLLLGVVVLCFVVIWRRDETQRTAILRSLEKPCSVLQAKVDAWKRLPSRLPELENAYYASAAERYYARQASEPVIIAFLGVTRLILQRDGCYVIVCEKGKVRPEWLTVDEFRRRWLAQDQKVHEFQQKQRAKPPDVP